MLPVELETLERYRDQMDPPASKPALVFCDIQPCALNALPETRRRSLMDLMQILIQGAALAEHKFVWSALRFSNDYKEIPINHKLYGALKRLYDKSGRAMSYVKGQRGTEISFPPCVASEQSTHTVLWRSSHLPSKSSFRNALSGCTHATVVGIKTSGSVQATVQLLCDLGLRVSVIDECIVDDDPERHEAMLRHFLPLYANVISISEWVEQAVGLDKFHEYIQKTGEGTPVDGSPSVSFNFDPTIRYFAYCGRSSHADLYIQTLLNKKGSSWSEFPLQPWITDVVTERTSQCPLLKQTVDFCDEPQFSRNSMVVEGSEWLGDAEKLWQIAGDFMPTTYFVEDKKWVGGNEPVNYNSEEVCCFVQERTENGLSDIQVCGSLSHALAVCHPKSKYVIQSHVPSPLLTISEKKKCHVKTYFLLKEQYGQWQLCFYPKAYLCSTASAWSPTDLRTEAQVVKSRDVLLSKRQSCAEWKGWPMACEAIKDIVRTVVKRCLDGGKIKSRTLDGVAATQFELFCAEILVDTSYKAWLLQCDLGCLLFDPAIDQKEVNSELGEYERRYDQYGEKSVVNDHDMINDTLNLILGEEEDASSNQSNKWEVIETF